MTTIHEVLSGCPVDSREARLLLASAGGFSEASVLAFPERELAPQAESLFRAFVQRRVSGEPVAYILGRKEFFGIELAVGPAVMIPRPETELLVDLALQKEFSSLVDLGTGSGAIALAVKKFRPAARVVAVDASVEALSVARMNSDRLRLDIEFCHGRWWEPLAGQRFDLVLANPPYVAEADPHLGALVFEPGMALTSGPDGLDAIREVIRGAPEHLTPGGWLLLEHGMGQEAAVLRLLQDAGLETALSWPDLARIPRVAGARLVK